MLNRAVRSLILGAVALTFVGAHAQEGSATPTLQIVRWTVIRDGVLQYLVFDAESNSPGLSNIQNIPNFLHEELDLVQVVLRITDADWEGLNDPDNPEEAEGVFLRFLALPNRVFEPPNVPPILGADLRFFGEFRPPLGSGQTSVSATLQFEVPEFVGRNQLRLRGQISFDVEYLLVFAASNEEEPEITDGFIGCSQPNIFCIGVDLHAIEKPGLGTSNPAPTADAGPDRTVATGAVVTLDASRTFDGSNIGFNPGDDLNIFDKDRLTYTWEWISGPVPVTPIQDAQNDPTARVLLTELGVYVYRVTVDDNANSIPSQDSVAITVLESLPINLPPQATITGPASSILLGATITLDGSKSSDPDDDELSFRWRQVDELGRTLDPNDLARVFQPTAGLTSDKLTWQAVRTGTFYFELTVSDGEFDASVPFQVTVIDPTVAGILIDLRSGTPEITGNHAPPSNSNDTVNLRSTPLCGTGLASLAMLPFALLLIRRPRR